MIIDKQKSPAGAKEGLIIKEERKFAAVVGKETKETMKDKIGGKPGV